MASNNRDVKMTLSVESLGQDNIDKLEKSLRELAKQGGKSSAEFGALADEIQKLGSQSQALQAVKTLADSTEVLAQKQAEARARVDEMAAKLGELRAATASAKDAQDQARAALVAGDEAYKAATGAVRALKAEYDAAGKRTEEYRTKLQALVATQNSADKVLVALREANRQTAQAVTEATAAQSKAETQLNRANKAYDSVTTAVNKQNAALREASGTAERLGVDTSNLADAEIKLQSAFSQSAAQVQQRQQALREMAEADKLAAIEAQGMLDLYRKGEQALQAEVLAQRDATRAVQEYEAAKAKALADEQAWQREAYAIVEAAEAAQKLARAQKEVAEQQAFEKAAADAQALVRASEYVRFWENALEGAEKQARESAAAAQEAANKIDSAFATVGTRSVESVRREIAQVNESMRLLASTGQLTGRELATAMQTAQTRVNGLEREIRELTGTLTLADKAADLFANSMGQIAAGNLIADAIGSLIERVKEMGREFIQANKDMDRLQRTMAQLHGSTEMAAQQIEFLRNTADLAGTSVADITDSFIRFQAAATASGMSLEEVNGMFQAVTVNGSKMGMSSDRIALSLEALGQMASKGVISMEELRQQLGDSLPGATAIAAKGLGLTVAELTKIVETGQLTAEQFFPAFRRGMEETFGSADKPVEGLWQSIARLGNEFTKLYQEATNSTAFKVLGQAVDGITNNFETLTTVIGGVGKALVALKLLEYVKGLSDIGNAAKTAAADIAVKTTATANNTAATTVNTKATADNTAALLAEVAAQAKAATGKSADTAATVANTAAKVANTAATKAQVQADAIAAATAATAAGGFKAVAAALGSLGTAARGAMVMLGGLPGLLLMTVLNAKELGTAIGESAAQFVQWVQELTTGQKSLTTLTKELEALEAAEKKRAAELEAIRAKEFQAIQKQVTESVKKRATLEAEVVAAGKAVEAEKARAELLERTTALYGDEAQSLQAAVTNSQAQYQAMQNEQTARQAVVAALTSEIAQRQQLVDGLTVKNEKAEEELQKLKDLLLVKQEELGLSTAQVQSMRLEVAERQILAAAYQDNSAKVADYKLAMEDARITLESVLQMEKQGLPVKEAVAAAQTNLALQTRLYADANRDAKLVMENQARVEQAALTVKQAALNVRLQEVQSMAQVARSQGDLTKATELEIEAKKVQIEIVKLNAEAKTLEAKATRAAAEAELEELRTLGTLTKAKELELQARIASAKAKETEAGAASSMIRVLEEEIRTLLESSNALNNNTNTLNSNTGAINANTSAREASIAAREKELVLREREAELDRKERNVDKDGFVLNNSGERMSVDATSPTAKVMQLAQAAGLSEEQTVQLLNTYAINGKKTGWRGGFTTTSGVWHVKSWDTLVNEEIMRIQEQELRQRAAGASNARPNERTAASQAESTARGYAPAAKANTGAAFGGTRTVNINLNGRNHSVNVASGADADNLVAMLRQLENEGVRAA